MSHQQEPTEPMGPTWPTQASGPASQYAVPSILWTWWKRAHLYWSSGTPGIRSALVAAAALVIIASGIGTTTVLLNVWPKPDGYLWTSATEVSFIQFTEDQSGHLSGTWQGATATGGETIRSENVAFTGVANGSHVSLTVSFLGISSTVVGTLNGGAFTLNVPDQNGYVATDVFHAASVSDYNNALARLRQQTAAYAAATQSAQATATEQQAEAQATASTLQAQAQATQTAQAALDQAVTSANGQLSNDLSALNSDTQNLAGSTDFSSVLNGYSDSWAQMQKDYQKEQSDYQQGCGNNGYNAGVVSYDAGVVKYDLGTIQYDDGTLTYAENSMSTPLTQVRNDMQAVQTDWNNLQHAVAADTTRFVSAQYSAQDVNTALAAAQKQLDSSNKALQSAQNQAKQYDTEAAQMNTDAQNLANSVHC